MSIPVRRGKSGVESLDLCFIGGATTGRSPPATDTRFGTCIHLPPESEWISILPWSLADYTPGVEGSTEA